MTYYSLLDSDTQKELPNYEAASCAETLAHYGSLMRCTLTDENDGSVNRYWLDEWTDTSKTHHVNRYIPVWVCHV